MLALFGWSLTWWGVVLLAALDSSLLFFLPFGNDTLLVYLAARHRDVFWVYPLLTTAGSLTGAGVTYWIGRQAGEKGLERLVSTRRLDRLKARVKDTGAVAIALPAILPPPFPLTPFVLTCGALEVSATKFFGVFVAARLIRFGVEAMLARRYGEGILAVLESGTFKGVVALFIAVAVVGTVWSAIVLWRRTRGATRPHRP